jgi:hypothetical protein
MREFIEVTEIVSIHSGEEGMFSVKIKFYDNGTEEKEMLMEFNSYEFLNWFDKNTLGGIKKKLISHINNL